MPRPELATPTMECFSSLRRSLRPHLATAKPPGLSGHKSPALDQRLFPESCILELVNIALLTFDSNPADIAVASAASVALEASQSETARTHFAVDALLDRDDTARPDNTEANSVVLYQMAAGAVGNIAQEKLVSILPKSHSHRAVVARQNIALADSARSAAEPAHMFQSRSSRPRRPSPPSAWPYSRHNPALSSSQRKPRTTQSRVVVSPYPAHPRSKGHKHSRRRDP